MTDVFDEIAGRLDYPMFVVTTVFDQQRAGCLVGFATQASIEPGRFLVGLSTKNHTYTVAQDAEYLAVHVLGSHDVATAGLFGAQTGDEVDKFARCSWHAGPYGLPILDTAAAWFVARILSRTPLGDHVAYLVNPVIGEIVGDLDDLLMSAAVRDIDPGHPA
jgi:flavin reductase (DIM6/NTAB) family NADH-FMN oxidoreductase RutF